MRKINLVFLIIALFVCVSMTVFAFPDISDSKINTAVTELSQFDIISGYEDGTFKPNNNITRAEFAKIVICATFYNYTEAKVLAGFDDADFHWAKEYIYVAKDMGIVNGTSKATFSPDDNVTYEQAIKMIIASLGYNQEAMEKGGYPNGYIMVANELGLLSDISYNNTDMATRGNIALIICKAFDVQFFFLNASDEGITLAKSVKTLRELHEECLVAKNNTSNNDNAIEIYSENNGVSEIYSEVPGEHDSEISPADDNESIDTIVEDNSIG